MTKICTGLKLWGGVKVVRKDPPLKMVSFFSIWMLWRKAISKLKLINSRIAKVVRSVKMVRIRLYTPPGGRHRQHFWTFWCSWFLLPCTLNVYGKRESRTKYCSMLTKIKNKPRYAHSSSNWMWKWMEGIIVYM